MLQRPPTAGDAPRTQSEYWALLDRLGAAKVPLLRFVVVCKEKHHADGQVDKRSGRITLNDSCGEAGLTFNGTVAQGAIRVLSQGAVDLDGTLEVSDVNAA